MALVRQSFRYASGPVAKNVTVHVVSRNTNTVLQTLVTDVLGSVVTDLEPGAYDFLYGGLRVPFDVLDGGGALPSDAVRSVMVVTGNEARPDADLVIWNSPDDVTPVNAAATDLIARPSTGGTVDSSAPTAPTGLVASAITDTGFTLSWTASTDNTGVTAYEVEIGGTSLGTTPGTTYTVSGLTAGTNYAVRVRARDATGNWSAWAALAGGVTTTTSGATTELYANDFSVDGAAAGWVNPDETVPNVSGGLLVAAGWGAYNRLRHGGVPREVKVEATFESAIDAYQGIFLGWSGTTGTGIKFFNAGGQWVVGNASQFNSQNTNVSGVPLGTTRIALAYDGTNVTAWAGDTQVFQAPFASLGIDALDTAAGNAYFFGYCGEAKHPYLTNIVVTSP